MPSCLIYLPNEVWAYIWKYISRSYSYQNAILRLTFFNTVCGHSKEVIEYMWEDVVKHRPLFSTMIPTAIIGTIIGTFDIGFKFTKYGLFKPESYRDLAFWFMKEDNCSKKINYDSKTYYMYDFTVEEFEEIGLKFTQNKITVLKIGNFFPIKYIKFLPSIKQIVLISYWRWYEVIDWITNKYSLDESIDARAIRDALVGTGVEKIRISDWINPGTVEALEEIYFLTKMSEIYSYRKLKIAEASINKSIIRTIKSANPKLIVEI